jgi:hypothetical protein
MMRDVYSHIRKFAEENNKYIVKRTDWFQRFVQLIALIFGVQIAFYGSSQEPVNRLYIAATVSQAAALLLSLFATYHELWLRKQTIRRYKEKIESYIRSQGEDPGLTFSNSSKFFELIQACSLFFFFFAVCLFCASLMINF